MLKTQQFQYTETLLAALCCTLQCDVDNEQNIVRRLGKWNKQFDYTEWWWLSCEIQLKALCLSIKKRKYLM